MAIGPLLNALVGAVTLVSLALAVLALAAWRRERRARFAILAGAFGVLFLRSAFFTAGLFLQLGIEGFVVVATAADALLLLLIYLAVVR